MQTTSEGNAAPRPFFPLVNINSHPRGNSSNCSAWESEIRKGLGVFLTSFHVIEQLDAMRKPSLAGPLSAEHHHTGGGNHPLAKAGTRDLLSWSACGSGCRSAALRASKGKLDVRENSLPQTTFRCRGQGLPRPLGWVRGCPAICVTCGLLQKSLPVSNGLVHVLLPVHNFLIQSLERKVNLG